MDKTLDEQIADAVAVALSASGTPPVPPGLSANVDFGKLWEQAARLNLDLGLVHALATQVAAEDGSLTLSTTGSPLTPSCSSGTPLWMRTVLWRSKRNKR